MSDRVRSDSGDPLVTLHSVSLPLLDDLKDVDDCERRAGEREREREGGREGGG